MRGSHGLSARRARRTKSSRPEGPKAGPKGRQLEVGAQRAPRLLVYSIFYVWGAPSTFLRLVLETFLIEQTHVSGTAVKHKDEILEAHMGGQVGKKKK